MLIGLIATHRRFLPSLLHFRWPSTALFTPFPCPSAAFHCLTLACHCVRHTPLQAVLAAECARLCAADDERCLGVQIAVYHRGQPVAEVAAGVRGAVDPRPVTAATAFPLGELGF